MSRTSAKPVLTAEPVHDQLTPGDPSTARQSAMSLPFAPGWSTILETGSGVLFYRTSDGLQVMVDVLIDGRVVTRGHSFATIKAGYTAAVDLGGRILLYDSSTGDGAVAEVLGRRPVGLLRQRRHPPRPGGMERLFRVG